MKQIITALFSMLVMQGFALANDWPHVTAGKITEVKTFNSLPSSLQKMPGLAREGVGCPKVKWKTVWSPKK